MMQSAARLVVSGRVQGVCYRAWTRDEAGALGLTGWVRNRPDGTVEMWLEGRRELVEQMVARCHEGPPAAYVDHVAVEWCEATGCREFRVSR